MIWNLRTSQVDDACVVRTKDLTENVYNGFNTCYIAIDTGHTLSQEKQEFGEEAGHLFWLQKPKNIYCQIHHFCQVSAGYNARVPWNLSSTGPLENVLPHHCTLSAMTYFWSNTFPPHLKVFPEVPPKALASTKSCNIWGCCYSYESCAVASPWKEARQKERSQKCFLQACKSGF